MTKDLEVAAADQKREDADTSTPSKNPLITYKGSCQGAPATRGLQPAREGWGPCEGTRGRYPVRRQYLHCGCP